MEQTPVRDRNQELENLQDLHLPETRPFKKGTTKIISLKPKVHLITRDYIDTRSKILTDTDNGLTKPEIQERRKQGLVNVIPGLEESSWFGCPTCCASRENVQEEYAKIIRKHLSAKSLVIREGETKKIDREDLVPGDILLLSKGDKVNADAMLIDFLSHEKDLVVNAFLYTETEAPYQKEKIRSLGDPWERQELILAGTEVISGGAKAIVLAVGRDTAIGLIMKSLINKERKKND